MTFIRHVCARTRNVYVTVLGFVEAARYTDSELYIIYLYIYSIQFTCSSCAPCILLYIYVILIHPQNMQRCGMSLERYITKTTSMALALHPPTASTTHKTFSLMDIILNAMQALLGKFFYSQHSIIQHTINNKMKLCDWSIYFHV